MSLKITLKANERIIIGTAVITNGAKKSMFAVNNDTIILREKDILPPKLAVTPAARIYAIVQSIYTDAAQEHTEELMKTLLELTSDFLLSCPNEGVLMAVKNLNAEVLAGNSYRALKISRMLVDYEYEVLHHE